MLRAGPGFCGAAMALAVLMALPAEAASRRRAAAQPAQAGEQEATARLNEESLQRARQGMDAPSPGPDTTSNLNRMGERDAGQGRSMNQAPMPFR